jgi:hypothetical protein
MFQESLSRFVVVASISCGVSIDALARAQSSTCNNNSRTLQAPAGTTPGGSQSCTSVTFTIQVAGSGVTITTPSSCSMGHTVRSDDTFSCGPAATGIHCTAEGYPVNVGRVVATWEYSNYRSLAPDVWRPCRIVQRNYVPGSTSPYLTTTMTIQTAVLMNTEEATAETPRPRSAEDLWFVRR